MIKAKRDFFAAATAGLIIRICETLPDRSLRALMWSKLTRAERRRGEEIVKLLAPDATSGFCGWKSPNRPNTVEVATAVEEFVAAVERRHGDEIWSE